MSKVPRSPPVTKVSSNVAVTLSDAPKLGVPASAVYAVPATIHMLSLNKGTKDFSFGLGSII